MTYDINQIQEKLSEVITTFKKAEPNYAQIWAKTLRKGLGLPEYPVEQKLPEYFPGYSMTVDYMERIKIHAEHGLFPEKMFLKRAPNQTQQEFDYIKANYKNVTFPFFMDYVSTVTRAFSDPNCGVDFKETEDKEELDTFRQYVESEIPQYGSIEEFMQGIIPTLKAIDANGVIAIKPNEIHTLTETDEQGNEIIKIDTTERINPAPFYFSSRQVVGFQEGDFCMVELNEKSEVNYGNQKLKIGKIFEFYDEQNIWRITQVGDFIDYEFDIQIWYEHGWDKMPVTRLKGIPRIHHDELIWLSPLIFVTDILDLVTMNSQYLQGSMATACYPYRVMYGDLCEFQGQDGEGQLVACKDGNLVNGAGIPINKTCSQCNGTGLKSRISPFGVMLLKPPMRDEENEGKLTNKPMEWISPEVTTLDFLLKKIGLDYQKAKAILHLDYNTNTVNPGNTDATKVSQETATQAASGQKALYAFVKSVSDQTFDIYQFILDAIGWMRYGSGYQRAVVKYPTTFDFLNTMDYIGQIGFAVSQKVPSIILYQLIYNYLQSVYNDDKDTASAFKLIVETDRLLTLTQPEVEVKQSKGTIEKWEEILHTSAPYFVQELIKSFNPTCKAEAGECVDTFFTQDLETQKKQLIKLAQDRAKEIEAAQPKPQEGLIRSIVDKNNSQPVAA